MGLDDFKKGADISAEYKKVSQQYEAKKAQLRQRQMKEIITEFKAYFKQDPSFDVSETMDGGAEAVYGDRKITIKENDKQSNVSYSVYFDVTVGKKITRCSTTLFPEFRHTSVTPEREKLRQTKQGQMQDEINTLPKVMLEMDKFQFNYGYQKNSYPTFTELLDSLIK